MEIAIDIDDPMPLFAQLVSQIKHAVGSSALAPGNALPSIRQLANDLDINAKTVAKAYRQLERDSIIQTRGYRGTFVHPDAQANCTIDLDAIITGKLEATIIACRADGATDSEIRIAFSNVMNNKKGA